MEGLLSPGPTPSSSFILYPGLHPPYGTQITLPSYTRLKIENFKRKEKELIRGGGEMKVGEGGKGRREGGFCGGGEGGGGGRGGGRKEGEGNKELIS